MNIASMHEACQKANLPEVQSLLSQFPELIDEPDQRYGWTPLHRSLICGHSSIAKLLLKQGADPNRKTAVGEPPLYLAVDLNQPPLVQLLLNYGAEPNCRNADGETPLHLATFKGIREVMETLLMHGADPNLRDSVFDRTPIHIATEREDEESIQLLLRYDAAPPPSPKPAGKSLRRDNALSKSVSPGPVRRGEDIKGSARRERKSSGNWTPEKGRRAAYEGISEIDQLNQKIRSVLSSKDESLSSQSITVTEATVAEPDSEKFSSNRSQTPAAQPMVTLENDSKNGLIEWLHDVKLDELGPRLLESGFDDIEELISQQSSDMPLTPQILKDIGIDKPGHRYVLLAALELEGLAAMQVTKKTHHVHTYSCMNPYTFPSALMYFPSLDKWLASLSLELYTQLFRAAGFEHYDQILALMHTAYKLNEGVLENEIGIKKLGHRHRILSNLHESAKDSDPRRLMFTSGGHHFRVPVRRTVKTDVNQSCQVM